MPQPRFAIILLLILFTLPIAGQVKNNNLDLVFIGNSITQGVQLADANEESPPAFAAKYLRTLDGVESVRFLNRGKSGFTTVNFLPAAADGELPKVIAAVKTFHTDANRVLVFSISLGTNDSAEEGPKGSPLWPEEYQTNMKAITDKLLSEFPGCLIFYQQPIWYSTTTYNRSKYLKAGLDRLQSYFPALRSLVAEYNLSNKGRVYMGDTKAFDYFRENHLTEFIPEEGQAGTFYLHPNRKGAESLGRFWGMAIYEVLFPK
ncbi:MAG: GDSL-type esterase/lipase family protein [Bacteroidales bacterium]